MKRRRYQLAGPLVNPPTARDEEWWKRGNFLGENIFPQSDYDPLVARRSQLSNVNLTGPINTSSLTNAPISGKTKFMFEDFVERPTGTGPEKAGFNWGKAAGTANAVMPFISNLANAFRRVPKPRRPQMEQGMPVQYVNYDSDRAELDRQQVGTNQGLQNYSANPSFANAQRASLLGKYLEAKGRVSQNERNTNAMIANQNYRDNSAIKARNTERENAYRNALTEQQIAQQQAGLSNIANFSDKWQLMNRDKAMMDLENRRLEILPRVWEDSGVYGRNLEDLGEAQKAALVGKGLANAYMKRMGGRLRKVYC